MQDQRSHNFWITRCLGTRKGCKRELLRKRVTLKLRDTETMEKMGDWEI